MAILAVFLSLLDDFDAFGQFIGHFRQFHVKKIYRTRGDTRSDKR